MEWSEVLTDKSLRDLPFKIETNRYGQIVMNPASNRLRIVQGTILGMLSRMNSRGKVISGCAVETSDGIKVADATWTSPEFLRSQHQGITYSIAPELCVEVQETADDAERFSVKRALYFEKGAQEVWICNLEGDVAFYNAQGEIRSSDLFPDFPKHVDLD